MNTRFPSPHRSILAVANQKGGVGKTTTAVNLGAALAQVGQHVLVVDLDPQANATSALGVDKGKVERSIYEALIGQAGLAEVIVSTGWERLDLAASAIRLAGAEIEMVGLMAREQRLRRTLSDVVANYDVILIDCSPSLGLLTVNALTAADGILIPIQCEYLALEALGQLTSTINLIRDNLNPKLDIAGILMTMFDARTNLSQQVVDEVRAHFPTLVFDTVIPRSVRLSEAPSYGQPILYYDPPSRGAVAYRNLAAELIARLERLTDQN
ncbi:MAG TPA: AAA family ATPase [Chloroflexota bacterium]|jgi:chromosome partitioning protein|nr:AAA family ATPase [Chloroflexota bacterium]